MASFRGTCKQLMLSGIAILMVSFAACGGNGGSIFSDNGLSSANLKSLELSVGSLCPVFDPDTLSYSVEVPSTTESIDISPVGTASDATVAISVNGTKVETNTIPAKIALASATTTIIFDVSAKKNTITKQYTVVVKKLTGASTNANLSGISLSAGNLSPFFDPNITAYNAELPKGTESVSVTAIAAGVGATVKVNGTEKQPVSILSKDLENPVSVEVTAEDGTTKKVYSVVVKIITTSQSANADLVRLTLSSGMLSPVFSANTLAYSTELPKDTKEVSVTATAAGINATVTVNDDKVDSAKQSSAITLVEGNNLITVVVTAENGKIKKTYTITATVLAAEVSPNANLAKLVLSKGNLNPAFSEDVTSYTSIVSNSDSSITVTPTAVSQKAAVTVNTFPVSSGTESQPIILNEGENTITIVVTPQDTIKPKTYTLNVTREAAGQSTNANLQSLTLSQGSLKPVFSSGETDYTAEVSSDVTLITVTPVAESLKATIKVKGETVLSNTASQNITLKEGDNNINIVVTSESGDIKTYKVNVTRRAAGASTNADLQTLSLSQGTLVPGFASATFVYTSSVANDVSSITVTPTTSDSKATVTVNTKAVSSGSPSDAIALSEGANTITVVVTAEDGKATNTYTVTVTRLGYVPPVASTNANLYSLALSDITLVPAFAAATTAYTASVANTVASTMVTPTVADAKATVAVNGVAVTSGSATSVALGEGTNTINVLVTAEDTKVTKTYAVTVTRQAAGPSSNADLSSVTLTKKWTQGIAAKTRVLDVTLDPAVTEYDVICAADSWEILPTVNTVVVKSDADATVKITNQDVSVVTLPKKNPTTISVEVTAADTITKKTYKFKLHRP